MPIQILPPQLANQIAAGEVVERPASVLKELVENCVDAGASKIDIEIERGGSKSIVVRDNGRGIPQAELELALARHATSKVTTLEDLEAILSFGFRGEALASISSVARLTLSSRHIDADQAWQAYAEGREMAVKVQPTAHPVGTTVEVVDLFFNTPARRRFLRADKTEFTHIEEQLRRIALAQPEIHFSLRHNGKLVRQYRPARNERQQHQRLASICGSAFAERAFALRCSNDDLALTGYLALDDDRARVSDAQYFYVNGRVVRDRLVNHAVRQALEEAGLDWAAGYVLYLTLDPHEVDVNVHPAKHEVRFHQARYVHDFILTALQQALAQHLTQQPATETPSTQPASTREYPRAEMPRDELKEPRPSTGYADSGTSSPQRHSASSGHYVPRPLQPQHPRREAVDAYGALLSGRVDQSTNTSKDTEEEGWRWLCQLDPNTLLMGCDGELRLLPSHALVRWHQQQVLLARLPQGLIGQPLLLPVSVPADVNWITVLDQQGELLRRLGIEVVRQGKRLVVRTVPSVLRQADLVSAVSELFQWLAQDTPGHEALAKWLARWSPNDGDSRGLWQQLAPEMRVGLVEEWGKAIPWKQFLESKHD
ncbi:DNA mismatch repair endonuclease MutL [Ferrimonas gelatinilytica]|uniref:DNA mismatch repair protein MutL n=1 Tax=Ferrimonas gelatinilytica TaxID=1255257 RepID=A0ABP9S2D2_9GAMM